ncbi:MAG TPA: DUF885 family protein [Gemmatimonadaceae bacterium]|nr:DUF885 family protein [Gemmatimonadaceae bacterium]
MKLLTPAGVALAMFATSATFAAPARAQTRPRTPVMAPSDPLVTIPNLAPLVARSASELADVLSRYSADQATLSRRYDAEYSPDQRRRMREFYAGWRTRLREVDFTRLSQEGKVDYVLLDNRLKYQLALLDREDKLRAETTPLVPFADQILALQDARRNLLNVDPVASARTLAAITRRVDSLRASIEPSGAGRGGGVGVARGAAADSALGARGAAPRMSRTVANRAADNVEQARSVLGSWYRFYDGYDPVFTWWARDPFTRLDEALARYARTIRERLVGLPAAGGQQVASGALGRGGAGAPAGAGGRGGGGGGGGGGRGDESTGPIIGDPIGADGLKADLEHEMIPYTPAELIAIAEREYAFSLSEIKKAAREMGFGDEWKAAMEKVKNTFVEPGKQPELIRELARQAEEFLDKHDWVTIPPLAREDWRMEMMSPERQRVSPFFLGGEQITVSYPTAEMSDDDKLMSMRGNNPHFSHATVFHELNPGHHLQGFMTARYNAHRRMFSTPFWGEGYALYWEMFLWDHDFHVSPEDRIGALFWRMHRSARIIFSLNFHLGKMTPEQAIQFLVDTVNFERANAEGEVRRSFTGAYSPLYQAGYMLGGLQLRGLYRELVESRRMTVRQFHDAVLQGGPMPIAMVRARLANTPLTRDGAAPWRFADALPPARPRPSP